MILEMWRINILFCFITIGSALYFPMGDLELSIPGKDGHAPWERPITVLKVLPDHGRRLQNHDINYTCSSPSGFLDIGRRSGELRFKEDVKKINESTKISVGIQARDSAGHVAETVVRVELEPAVSADCELLTRQLCFWKNMTYKLYENRRATVIGSLNSLFLTDLCERYDVNYQLLNSTKLLSIVKSKSQPKKWNLKSLKSFERDINRHEPKNQLIIGTQIYFAVKCTVTSPGGTQRAVEETFSVEVLDENDNVPVGQGDETVEIWTNNGGVEIDQLNILTKLLFVDRDSKPMNNYTYTILEDTKDIFEVKCTDWEDDREGEPQTVIRCKLLLKRNVTFSDVYTVILQINDTSLLPGNGDSTVNTTINIYATSKPTLPPRLPRSQHLFPHEVSILRHAAPLARVAQPERASFLGSPHEHAIFKLKIDLVNGRTDVCSGCFNVTEVEGIVYVQNITKLSRSKATIEVEVEWQNQDMKKYSDVFIIHLITEGNPTCTDSNMSLKHWQRCAEHVNHRTCSEACGIGTGGSAAVTSGKNGGSTRCVWRGEKKPSENQALTALYSTCTPDIHTCPDHKCDALEDMFHYICPQDCEKNILHSAKINKNGRGIEKAAGVCKCDSASCVCNPMIGARSSQKKTTTVTTAMVPETTTVPVHELNAVRTTEINFTSNAQVEIATYKDTYLCGTTCKLGIGGGVLFLLVTLVTVVGFWRSGKGDRRAQKYVESVSSLSGLQPSTDRTIRVAPTETLHINFDMNRSICTNITLPKVTPVDPKWEFPRERLHVEQALGEGQFGRVFRARALDIANLPGFTTVAVKTLKQDARESELADLMSEYQLLKDVSHPNVIRLFGASTLPGGPVYLIIEFAEYGSLRSYLRRSRHLESEGRTPCSEAMLGTLCVESQPETRVCQVTPRDILSFSWQISKGMTYLCDMKLVHRDLAARNILLAEGMVCKISDFGLTRDVYEDDNYLKRTRGRVPVKWMAPESLSDHIYNSKSDVWSFGVMLWELVTLGASPYPGIAVQNLYHHLKSGYRMEKPENCSPTLYKVMKCCWHGEPAARPTFRTLNIKLEAMLADGVDYLDLTPKIVHNRTYFTNIPHALTPDDNDDTIGYGDPSLLKSEEENLLSGPDVKKCADADKLQVLWRRPESPKPSYSKYVNEDVPSQELHHYESPIKLRSNSNESPKKQERPQSYMDMAGGESELCKGVIGDGDNKISKITSL